MSVTHEHRPAGASDEWLSQVPALVDALREEWHLDVDDEHIGAGAVGLVFACRTDEGEEAVLKLCPHRERLNSETSALLSWAGGPAIRVLAYRPGALLLERARPGTPSRLAPSQLSMLLNALHRRTSGTDAGLTDWRESIDAATMQVPSLQALGRQLLQDGEGRPAVTLHGDLQPANILGHRGATAVIDPIGIAGPRELDVATAALYNNWGEESTARIRRLAQLTGTDAGFALRFAQLSAMYASLARRY